jgi:hypothetical protein
MQQCAGAVETKKFVVFPGRCLGQQKSALVESAGNAKMLENFSAPGDNGWFQRCSSFHGKTGGSAEANPMDADDREWCLA